MVRGTVGTVGRVISKIAQSHSPHKMGRFVRFRNGKEQQQISRDVPKGHCAVYVGEHRSRFIIPTSFLNHSLFADLLQKSADEFGFDHHLGIIIPCDVRLFEHLTSFLSTATKKKNKLFHFRMSEIVAASVCTRKRAGQE